MDKIKVLHALSYSHYPERFYNLLKEMMKYFDIYVLYSDYCSFRALNKYMPFKVYWSPSLNLCDLFSLKNAFFVSLSDVSKILKIVKPDIIHVHTHYFISNYQVVKVAKQLKIPTMLDIQGIIESKNFLMDILQNIYIRSALLKWLLYNVDGIRFASSYDYMYIKALCKNLENKSKIIPNFIELDKYYISKKIPFSIVWHGRLVRKKRVDLIVKAIAELCYNYKITNLIFYLIGYGSEYPRIMKFARKYRIVDHILYKPYLKTQELIDLLSKMEVIPYTSTYEGNPYSLLEAAACGVYPIGFKTPGTYETIHVLGGKIVEDRNVPKLAAGIAEVFLKGYNPDFLRRRIEKYYSPKVILPKLRNFYQEIISQCNIKNV
jgi:glycosyltransferase involved in cell wall biosynthesis